jgi:hypothetical protein
MTDIVFHIAGYGFGLGVAVRLEAVPGSIGERWLRDRVLCRSPAGER